MIRRTSDHFGSIKFLFVYVFYPILYRFIVQLWEIQAWTLKYLMSSMKRPKKQGQKMQFLTLFFAHYLALKITFHHQYHALNMRRVRKHVHALYGFYLIARFA